MSEELKDDIFRRGELSPQALRVAIFCGVRKALKGRPIPPGLTKREIIDYAIGAAGLVQYDRERTIRESFKFVEINVCNRVIDFIKSFRVYKRRVKICDFTLKDNATKKPVFLSVLDNLAAKEDREKIDSGIIDDEQTKRAAALRCAFSTLTPAVRRLAETMAQGFGLREAARRLGISVEAAYNYMIVLKVACFKAYLKDVDPLEVEKVYKKIRDSRPERFRKMNDGFFLEHKTVADAARPFNYKGGYAHNEVRKVEKYIYEELYKNARFN